jgi:hypothetical protein
LNITSHYGKLYAKIGENYLINYYKRLCFS